MKIPIEHSMELRAGTLTLLRDQETCEDCGTCFRLLPDYIRKYKGKLLISKYRYNHFEEAQNAVQNMIEACSRTAISLKAEFVYLPGEVKDLVYAI